jgi:hypothetical protein
MLSFSYFETGSHTWANGTSFTSFYWMDTQIEPYALDTFIVSDKNFKNNVKKGPIQGFNLSQIGPSDFVPWTVL